MPRAKGTSAAQDPSIAAKENDVALSTKAHGGKGVARSARFGAGLLAALLVVGCAGPEHQPQGPLPVRTQHHVELQVLDLAPRRALAAAAGELHARVQLFWTNTVLAGRAEEFFLFDLELVRLSAPLRLGLGAGLDLELEPGLQWAGPGALDGAIDAWHQTFGFPEGFRPAVPQFSFSAYVEREGTRVLELEPDRLQPTDLPLVLSWHFLESHSWLPDLLGRAGLELPLGSARRGAGNGGWDTGAGLVASRRLGAFELTGDLSYVLPASPRRVRRLGLSYDPRWSGGIGLEAPLGYGCALLVQLRAHQSVLGDFDSGSLNRSQLLLWTGGRIPLGKGLFLEGSVGEDLIQKVSPDVTFHLGLGGRF